MLTPCSPAISGTGQSNYAGQGDNAEIPEQYADPTVGTWIYDYDYDPGGCRYCQPGYGGVKGEEFGIEVSMMATIGRGSCAKYAYGGQAIDIWDPTAPGVAWPRITHIVDKMLQAWGAGAMLDIWFWWQGERESNTSQAAADAYEAKEWTLFDGVWSRYGSQTQIISMLTTATAGDYSSTVRAAKATNAAKDSRIHTLDADDYELYGVHHTPAGYIAAGIAIGSLINSITS